MRKKISCRVIESIPLIHSEDGLINAHQLCTTDLQISGFAGLTHLEHSAMIRIFMDNDLTTGILDFYA